MDQTVHEQIVATFEAYIAESAKFQDKGVAAAGTRARAALGDLTKLAKVRRAEIQDTKNAKKAAK